MLRSSFVLIAVACGGGQPAAPSLGPATTERAVGSSVLEEGLCPSSSSDQRAALEQLARLDRRIRDEIEGDHPIEPVVATLREHLEHSPCYALARYENPRFPSETGRQPDSVLALRTWWVDGGHEWLRSYLGDDSVYIAGRMRRAAFLPPDVRTTMLAGASSGSAHPLLCPHPPSDCGDPAAGWRRRADIALYVRGANISPDEVSRRCTDHQEYEAWRGCLEQQRPTAAALPLGDFRAPNRGWLIVHRVVGHYTYELTVVALELETGTLYRAQSLTGEESPIVVEMGVTWAANGREAVWMMALSGAVEEAVQKEAVAVAVPEGMVRRWSDSRVDMVGEEFGVAGSGIYAHAWRWLASEGELAGGELKSLGSSGERYALELLEVAELAMRSASPERCLPDAWLVPPSGTSARAFYDRGDYDRLHRALIAASAARCRVRTP